MEQILAIQEAWQKNKKQKPFACTEFSGLCSSGNDDKMPYGFSGIKIELIETNFEKKNDASEEEKTRSYKVTL